MVVLSLCLGFAAADKVLYTFNSLSRSLRMYSSLCSSKPLSGLDSRKKVRILFRTSKHFGNFFNRTGRTFSCENLLLEIATRNEFIEEIFCETMKGLTKNVPVRTETCLKICKISWEPVTVGDLWVDETDICWNEHVCSFTSTKIVVICFIPKVYAFFTSTYPLLILYFSST